MKYLTCINREVATLTDGKYTVRIIAGEGVEYNGTEPIETVGEALLIGDLLAKSIEKTFYVFYDQRGLRITENAAEAPEGALVVDCGEFFTNRTIFNPKPPPAKWKFRKPPRSRR